MIDTSVETASRLWEIPFVVPSLNVWQRAHWGVRKKYMGDWVDLCWAFMNNREKSLPGKSFPWVFVSAQMIFATQAHRDIQNYDAVFWKIFPDALQTVGVIKDDDDKHLLRGKITLDVQRDLKTFTRDPRLKGVTRVVLTVPS